MTISSPPGMKLLSWRSLRLPTRWDRLPACLFFPSPRHFHSSFHALTVCSTKDEKPVVTTVPFAGKVGQASSLSLFLFPKSFSRERAGVRGNGLQPCGTSSLRLGSGSVSSSNRNRQLPMNLNRTIVLALSQMRQRCGAVTALSCAVDCVPGRACKCFHRLGVFRRLCVRLPRFPTTIITAPAKKTDAIHSPVYMAKSDSFKGVRCGKTKCNPNNAKVGGNMAPSNTGTMPGVPPSDVKETYALKTKRHAAKTIRIQPMVVIYV